MEIKTKFNLDDIIWIIDSKEVEEICPICEGKGLIDIKNETFDCPKCNTNGKIKGKYESIPRGKADFPMHFYCEKCKNQSIGDDSGTIYDCNLCKIVGDNEKGKLKYEHIYCVNYVKE